MNDCAANQLSDAIKDLAHELRATRECGYDELKKGLLAIEKQVAHLERNIMSQISELTDRFNARFDEIGTSVDEIVASQVGIAADVAALKDIIAKLQNNPGPISPEDQLLLDAAEARLNGLATKTAAASAALKDLDDQTATPPA